MAVASIISSHNFGCHHLTQSDTHTYVVCFYRAAGVWPANGATNRRYLCHYLLKVPIVLLLVLLRCSPRKIVQYRYLYLQSRSSRGFSPPAPSHSLIRHPTARWRIENELRRIFKLHRVYWISSSICTSLRLKTIQFWPATGVAKSGRWNHFTNSSVVWRILRDQNILSVRKYLPFYLCFWLYWDKNVYNTKCMYINLTLKIKPNAKIQMNNMKFFSRKNCI